MIILTQTRTMARIADNGFDLGQTHTPHHPQNPQSPRPPTQGRNLVQPSLKPDLVQAFDIADDAGSCRADADEAENVALQGLERMGEVEPAWWTSPDQ